MGGIGIVLSATDLGYEAPTEAEVRQALRSISVVDAVPFVGRLNTALQVQLQETELQGVLADLLLGEDVRRRLEMRAKGELMKGNTPLWVVPAHLRIVLKILIEEGDRDGGGSVADAKVRADIGRAILSATPTFRSQVDLGPRPRHPLGWLHDLMRFLHEGSLMSGRAFQVISHKEMVYDRIFRDEGLLKRFVDAYGAKPSDVHRAVLALHTIFASQDADALRFSSETCVDHRMLFGRLDVPRSAGSLVLSTLARDLRQAENLAAPPDGMPWGSDIRFLVTKPLALIDDNLVCCLDFDLLRSAYGRLVFNLTTRLLGGRSDATNQIVHKAGADLFQELAQSFFTHIRGARGDRSRVESPFGDDDHGDIDGLCTEEHEVAIFEFKSGQLSPNLLYGHSVEELAAEIDKKYITADDRGKRKGFAQLADSAARIMADPSLVGLRRVKRLYPVLVVEDDTLPFKPAALYALNRAYELFAKLDRRVQNPVILHIEDLALLAERSGKYSVPYMLRRMWREGFEGFCFRDLILRRLPINEEDKIDIERPFPLTDSIIDSLRDMDGDLQAPACSTCGELELRYTNSHGRVVTRCKRCERADERPVPAEVLAQEEEWSQNCIQRCLAS